VSFIEPEKIPSSAFEPLEIEEYRDFYNEKPVSDDIFQVYKDQFDYDPQELNAIIEKTEESPEWITEKITFDAAYGDERISAYLFLPKNATPPYQTVIQFPGSDLVLLENSENILEEFTSAFDFIVKNKRAFLFPIYKGTCERKEGLADIEDWHMGENTHRYSEYLIQIVKDFKRSIDYLETREDIDSKNLAFYGWSWG
jgi:cephalosporin-C deacetylase-like acetyl esterase